jgi:predicted amidophosphoribosyltransferase
MSFSSEISALLMPTRCFGCRRLGLEICSSCQKYWRYNFYQRDFGGLKVFSTIEYSPVAKNILLAAKENGIKQTFNLINLALVKSVRNISEHYPMAALVPVPSQKSAIRRRGQDFTFDLATSVAKEFGVQVLPILGHNRKVRDQSRLDSKARSKNLAFSFSVDRVNLGNYSGKPVVILDDLVTTGATIIEANRALTKAGFEVTGGATACVALRRL